MFDTKPYTFFDPDQGMYFRIPSEKVTEFEKSLDQSCRCINDLKGWWDTPLELIGIEKSKHPWTIYKLGSEPDDLFQDVYYAPVFVIDPNQIFIIYGPGFGRNYIFKNGKWK